jgi:hypothetical protein
LEARYYNRENCGDGILLRMGLPHYLQGRKEYFFLDDSSSVRPKREIEVRVNTWRMKGKVKLKTLIVAWRKCINSVRRLTEYTYIRLPF